ncbi:MAG: phosphotransferase [Candidatus Azambacteria bacterium]|nr:phosphotransferase [Candidatus Azambacteria bacterium]
MADFIINEIKKRLATKEDFRKTGKGTRSTVYLSDHFVVKINKDYAVLKNESEVLKVLDLDVAPKLMEFYIIRDYGVLIEKKIEGQAIDDVWRSIRAIDKDKIATDIATAICKINQHKKKYFWSAQFDIKFKTYRDLLFYKFKLYQKRIFENKLSHKLFLEIANNITEKKVNKTFGQIEPTLLHGDLIMHNLLTDLRRLTGILDWEYAQYGDPFYDLARVIYYQECAKAYVDENRDEYFEYDFTTKLTEKLSQNINLDFEKYKIIRSFFFVDTIIWALNSADSEKHLSELQPPKF